MTEPYVVPTELAASIEVLSRLGAAIAIYNDGRCYFVNDRYVELLGYSRQRFMEPGFLDAISLNDDRERARQRFEARLRGEAGPERFETRLVTASGAVLQLDTTVIPIETPTDVRFLWVAFDETPKLVVQRELSLYQGAFESVARGLSIWARRAEDETAFELVLANESMPWNVVPGSTPAALGEHAMMVAEILARALKTGTPQSSPDCQVTLPAGDSHTYRVSARAMGPLHVAMTFDDVTFQRKLDREGYRAQKNEQLAMLSGTIAHDFSNLLTAIHTFAELGRETIKDDIETTDYFLAQIAQTAMQASQLSRNLLRFSRRDSGTPKPVHIGKEILKFQPILAALTRGKSELVVNVECSAWSAFLDPVHLEQVVVNLVGNANDAVSSDGGRILLEVADAPADATSGRDGDYVCITVRDNGSGIAPEDVARVFEPYFSRKDERGTGLGLAICKKIVQQYLGDIRLESVMGSGTTFEVLLPRHEESAAMAEELVEELVPLAGSERILLVEDQDGLRDVLVSFLERLGYRATGASTAAAAMATFVTEDGNIDVLVADVELSDSNGPELARQVLRKWPSVRVLFVSGASLPEQHELGNAAEKGAAFLPKPFTARQLARQVRLLVDGSETKTT